MVKPAPFAYHRAHSVDEAVAPLAELGDEAKILAGGLSLVPMMNFRLARPSALIDVTRVGGLSYLRAGNNGLRIGALTTHRTVETTRDPAVLSQYAVLPRSARWIGHYPIRSRGTFGGSIAHADPASEWGAAMAAIVTDDGVALHVEQAGQGEPLVFIHEFAGDHRSWEPQVRYFSAAYRCVTYAARGYPPSGVPTDPAAYSQARAVADAIAVLDGLGIDRAHLVGLSMGGFTALHLVLSHPDRVGSAVVAGAGYGAQPERADSFRTEAMRTAAAFAAEGAAKVAERYAVGPARVQFQNKNPRGWAEFAEALAGHSDLGSALTMRGVQAARPSLYALTGDLAKVRVPVLVLVGDEDEGCLEPALMLKRTIPTAGLAVLPRTGHTANLEEPDVFNRAVDSFLAAAARGAWRPRDPRSLGASLMTPGS